MVSYIGLISFTQWHSCTVPYSVGLHLNYETKLFIAPCNVYSGAICCQSNQEHRGEPLLFSISALGSFTCVTHHMGPLYIPSEGRGMILNVCLRTEVSRLGLEPTLCWAETPEFESGALKCYGWNWLLFNHWIMLKFHIYFESRSLSFLDWLFFEGLFLTEISHLFCVKISELLGLTFI